MTWFPTREMSERLFRNWKSEYQAYGVNVAMCYHICSMQSWYAYHFPNWSKAAVARGFDGLIAKRLRLWYTRHSTASIMISTAVTDWRETSRYYSYSLSLFSANPGNQTKFCVSVIDVSKEKGMFPFGQKTSINVHNDKGKYRFTQWLLMHLVLDWQSSL